MAATLPQSAQIPYDSMSTDALFEVANDAFEQSERNIRKGLDQCLVSGRALLAAKAQIAHGEWLATLKANWLHSQQWASRCMAMANYAHGRNLEQVESAKELLRIMHADTDVPTRTRSAETVDDTDNNIEPEATQEAAEPRRVEVQTERPARTPAPPQPPRQTKQPKPIEPESFDLLSSLDEDRTAILDMAAPYAAAKKTQDFCAMLRLIAVELGKGK